MPRRAEQATLVGRGPRVSTHTRRTQKGTTSVTTSMRTPFGFASTADEVIAGIDLSGQRAIVTGGAGRHRRSRPLVPSPRPAPRWCCAVRRRRGRRAGRRRHRRQHRRRPGHRPRAGAGRPGARSPAFVAGWDQAAAHPRATTPGSWRSPELERTAEGWEMQFATNFMGHFALTVRPARRPRRGRRGPGRLRQLRAATSSPRRLRRPALRLPALRPLRGLRAVQDRRRAARRRSHAPLVRSRASTPTR